MQPKISVIIPVHNPGMYLKQCLDSILNQTLSEIEVICVNDGSTDGSARLLDEYAKKDNRIKVIHQECFGAGAARNTALKYVTGEYLAFSDADDFCEDNMLEYMYYTAKADQADIMICAYYVYDNKTKIDTDIKYPLQEACQKSPLTKEIATDFLFDISFPSVSNKLFKTDLIREKNIFFAQVPRGEDLFFCWQAIAQANKISVQAIPFFHYRMGTSFQSSSVDGKPETPILFLKMIKELYTKLAPFPLWPQWEKSFIKHLKKCLAYELKERTGSEKRKALKEIAQELPKELVNKLFFNTEKPAVSLVVCVYNGEKYLAECLDSLINQTLSNIEIVCVDDGSTDGSLKILNDYAQKDKRIKVLTQENKKLSIARRTAMTAVTGEYTLYVDADDYLELDACECLYYNSKIFDLDMCSFMSMEFLNSTREDFEEPYHRLQWVPDRSNSTFERKELKDVIHRIAVTSGLTLYKNAFLQENHIKWLNEALFFEDTPFFTECLFRTEKFGVFKETFLHKRTHSQCITQNRDKHFADWCNIVLRVCAIVKRYGDNEILNNYLDGFSQKGWETYKSFSYQLNNKYEKEMFNFCTTLIQEYQHPLPDEALLWYEDVKTLSVSDILPFREAKKSINMDFDKASLFDAFTDFYHQMKDKNLYDKYHQNYLNYLRYSLQQRLFYCTVDEKEKFLMEIPHKLPDEVVQELLRTKNKSAVSIIVPVYNMEKYLPQCLESLIHQTLQNIEIICVDDGSTDSSLKILQDYAAKDNRIKILTQKNQKPTIARRNAMKIASGEYIQYVDADDFINLNTAECLYLYSKIHHLDMLLFAATNFQDKTNEPINVPYHHLTWMPENFVSVFSVKNIQDVIHQMAVTACLSFYRHDFLKENDIKWIDEPLCYEDTPFFIESILKAKRVGGIKKQFYHRRLHTDNTILQMENNFPDFCKQIEKTIDIAKEYSSDKVFNILFGGYIEKAYFNYQTFSERTKKKFEQTLMDFCTHLKEKYDQPLPSLIEIWYNSVLEKQALALFQSSTPAGCKMGGGDTINVQK